MAVANDHFETAGASAGLAASWAQTVVSTREELADVDTTTEAREDFEEGWRLPMGSPGVLEMFRRDYGTDVNTDGGVFASGAGIRARLFHDVVTPLSTGASLSNIVNYVDEVSGARASGAVTIPNATIVGWRALIPLAAPDTAPLDVTFITEIVTSGVVRVLGIRSLTWNEGTVGTMEANGTAFNDTGLLAFTDGVTITAVVYIHGTAFEGFAFGWSGLAGVVLNNFDVLGSAAHSFDALPAIASGAEPVEDFNEGWGSPRASTFILGTYRVSTNTSVAITPSPASGNAVIDSFPQPVNARARVTEDFGSETLTMNVVYRRFDADGGSQTGVVTVRAGAVVGQEYAIQVPPNAVVPGTEERGRRGVQRLDFGGGGVSEAPVDSAQQGAISIEVTQLRDPAADALALTNGTPLANMDIVATIGTGNAAVFYRGTTSGPIGAYRVRHNAVALPIVQDRTVAVRVGLDITVTLRNIVMDLGAPAGGVFYPGTSATAFEVADKVNTLLSLIRATGAANDPAFPAIISVGFVDLVLDTASIAATFDSIPENFENFENSWSNNQLNLTAFTGFTLHPATFGGGTTDMATWDMIPPGAFVDLDDAGASAFPELWLRIVRASGAAPTVVTITYMNQAGVAGRVATISTQPVNTAGGAERVTLQAPDTGIRDIIVPMGGTVAGGPQVAAVGFTGLSAETFTANANPALGWVLTLP